MKNKSLIVGVVVALVIGFLGGIGYGKSTVPAGSSSRNFGQNGAPTGAVGAGARGGARAGNMGGFNGGEVLSKDDKSITLKMRDGGSRLVFYSPSTLVTKSATGAISDIATGAQVSIIGKSNPDGSMTAESIQIRPAMPAGTTAPARQ